jgi:hypothetical protein
MAKVNCPECGVPLNLPAGLPAGKKIKCPKCSAVFAVPEGQQIQAASRPAAPPPPPVDEEYEEEVPRARKRPRVEEEYEEEERPARRRAEEDDYGEEAYDDEGTSRRRRKRHRAASPSAAVLVVALYSFAVGGIALLIGILILALGGTLIGMASSAASNVNTQGMTPQEAAQVRQAAKGFGTAATGLLAVIAGCWGIMAIPYIITGVGVLKRRQWGRIMAFIMGGFAAIGGLINLLGMNIVSILLALVLIGYCVASYVILFNHKFAAEFK